MNTSHQIITAATIKWIKDVVIECNFCPFANAALLKKSINYIVIDTIEKKAIIEHLLEAFIQLDENDMIETTFLIIGDLSINFKKYLTIFDSCEDSLYQKGYEGIYQIASFHPNYCFADSDELDPANYTNRSPYAMIHILRESSIDKALEKFPHPENIPIRNVQYAREKGLQYMQLLRSACM